MVWPSVAAGRHPEQQAGIAVVLQHALALERNGRTAACRRTGVDAHAVLRRTSKRRGPPLESDEVWSHLIAGTTTRTGLTMHAERDTG